MKENKLIAMAENIVNNFSAYGLEKQIRETIIHLEHFWTKEMKQDLIQNYKDNSDSYSEILTRVMNKIK